MLKVVNKTCIGDVELLAVDHEKLDLLADVIFVTSINSSAGVKIFILG